LSFHLRIIVFCQKLLPLCLYGVRLSTVSRKKKLILIVLISSVFPVPWQCCYI
jgi:hypothetical protein